MLQSLGALRISTPPSERPNLRIVKHDNIETAYDLAETYGDFRNLAELCHDPKSGDSERTKNYIERYGEAYTMELYQFYVERRKSSPRLYGVYPDIVLLDMLQVMFQQEERFSPYVDKFFLEYPQPRISWIQDLRNERFGQAAESLLQVSEQEPSLAVKHVSNLAMTGKSGLNSYRSC